MCMIRSTHHEMRKVLVIGSAGAGKTVLATKLGALTGLPVVHLDALHWKPGWVGMPSDAWKRTVAEVAQRECWIMDGNYGGTMDERLEACDTVVFLAFPRLPCLYRVFKRFVTYRGKTRPDLHPGCPEMFPDIEFLSWIWTYPEEKMPKILERLRSYGGRKEVFILRTPRAVEGFLTEMKQRFSDR